MKKQNRSVLSFQLKKCMCFTFTSAWETLSGPDHITVHSPLRRINESTFFPPHFGVLRLTLQEGLRSQTFMFCKHNPSHIPIGTSQRVCYQGSAGTRTRVTHVQSTLPRNLRLHRPVVFFYHSYYPINTTVQLSYISYDKKSERG